MIFDIEAPQIRHTGKRHELLMASITGLLQQCMEGSSSSSRRIATGVAGWPELLPWLSSVRAAPPLKQKSCGKPAVMSSYVSAE